MRAPVTGAARYCGSHLWERLISQGAAVAGLDCFIDHYPRDQKERKLAAQAGARESWGRGFRVYMMDDIEAARPLPEACMGKPIEDLVYASSSSAYRDQAELPMRREAAPSHPASPCGVTKLAAEQLCGPRFLRATVRGEALPLDGGGRQTRDITFVEDAVRATPTAADRGNPGRVYNTGGGSRVDVLGVAELIRRVTDRPSLTAAFGA